MTLVSSLQVKLGDSSQRHEVGHLVLSHVCPAVHAVMADGLRPHVRSLFGQVKNNVWKVVEQSTELGKLVEEQQFIRLHIQNIQYSDYNTEMINTHGNAGYPLETREAYTE